MVLWFFNDCIIGFCAVNFFFHFPSDLFNTVISS